jgi:hypothetical protein
MRGLWRMPTLLSIVLTLLLGSTNSLAQNLSSGPAVNSQLCEPLRPTRSIAGHSAEELGGSGRRNLGHLELKVVWTTRGTPTCPSIGEYEIGCPLGHCLILFAHKK